MKNKNSNISATIILVQSPKTKGYTVYFEQRPDIITEGNNEGEAIRNLFDATLDVFAYQNEIKDVITEKNSEMSKKIFKTDKIAYNVKVYKLPFIKNTGHEI